MSDFHMHWGEKLELAPYECGICDCNEVYYTHTEENVQVYESTAGLICLMCGHEFDF